MPYKHTLSEVLLMLFTNPPEAFKILCIMTGGALTRACLESANPHLKRLGDLTFCILAYYLIRPFIPAAPMVFGYPVPRGTIAILISLLGSHALYTLFRFFVKKRTGIDLKETQNNG